MILYNGLTKLYKDGLYHKDDELSKNPKASHYLAVRTSRDGGDTFSDETVVAELHLPEAALASGVPVMATDPARPGRLYVVWVEALPSGQRGVLFAASADKGTTFSRPVLLSEQPRAVGHDAFVPSVAVNAAGIVAVTWYDTRGLPPGQKGWNVRLRASGDGGESWWSSVRVTEESTLRGEKSRKSLGGVGDTAGLTADADGGFRCLWIDGRTGIAQVWTATVQIDVNKKGK
jgi:hypothetical protein